MVKSLFLEIVGKSPRMKILQYLIEGRHFDFSLSDIAEDSGVSWRTLHIIFPKLIKYRLVIKTREVGRAKLYKINKDNQISKKLMELYDYITTSNLNKYKEKEIIA